MAPSILIVSLEGLGDTVLSMPLLSVLSHAFKRYNKYLLMPPGRKDLFFGWERLNILDVTRQEEIGIALHKYHEMVFDLGTGTDHFLDFLPEDTLQYGMYIGFAKPKSIPRELTVPRPVNIHLWKQFVCLALKLGIATDNIPQFEIRTSPIRAGYAEMLLNGSGLPSICLAPGGHYFSAAKCWPPEHFANFMRRLKNFTPCRFVLLGDRSETKIGDAIADMVDFAIDNLMGLTTLGSLVHILRRSRILVANDNGAMHLGGLLGIPVIGLFGPSDPDVYSPLGIRSRVIKTDSGNIADISPEHVVNASLDLLKSSSRDTSNAHRKKNIPPSGFSSFVPELDAAVYPKVQN